MQTPLFARVTFTVPDIAPLPVLLRWILKVIKLSQVAQTVESSIYLQKETKGTTIRATCVCDDIAQRWHLWLCSGEKKKGPGFLGAQPIHTSTVTSASRLPRGFRQQQA